MLVALFADVHANREALEACMSHARGFDVGRYAFLGDLVGYGADPAWVVSLAMEYIERGKAIAVLGNHDAAVAGESSAAMHGGARKGVDWTRTRLTPDQLAFLGALPLAVEEDDTLYVHASACSPREWGYVLSVSEARASLLSTRCRITFCGHVHEPALYHVNRSGQVAAFAPVAGASIRLGVMRRWLAIAGTVGQPRDGKLVARYALFDSKSGLLTFFELPYDYESALEKTRRAGLPANIVMPRRQTPANVR
jgi:diadenosine tetraphosphatase ApaH/serine/threonine PP2A family protein phosphatase